MKTSGLRCRPLNCWFTWFTSYGPAASWARLSPSCHVPALLRRHATRPKDAAGLGPSDRLAWLLAGASPHGRRHRIRWHRVSRGRPTLCQIVTDGALDNDPLCFFTAQKTAPGRPPVKEKRLPKLTQVLDDTKTVWQRHAVPRWYGRTNRTVERQVRRAPDDDQWHPCHGRARLAAAMGDIIRFACARNWSSYRGLNRSARQ